ncbi:putative NADH-flavin reductase [Saccharothrix ecbatanensis]|uniref:Putative NADH-flavin reductase n=1 Tax=Saccharothrix ecbatanensis TaxID=1105145 RepID=A0A7W9HPS7_9PSEU|nr:NAD(P)H-binding protein [Saccharothrix ecbatanensis]MBB5805704.1 putative NADH-flavin reductase [Saccharothrix ecbatanensis]
MRITVFGAFGSVGRRVVEEARRRGHDVTPVSRRPGPDSEVGDARLVADVVRLSAGRDLVISATRPADGQEGELVEATKALLAGVAETGARLLAVGGAATLVTPAGHTVEEAPDFPDELKPIARACAEQLAVYLADPVADWTYLSPPALLEPGERTGVFRVGGDEQVGSTISVEDLAVALLDEAETPKHQRKRFTVGY